MFVPPDNVEFLIICVVSLCKPVEKSCNNIRVVMANKEVLDVPADCHLLAIDEFVGNAGIVGLISKPREVRSATSLQ